MKPLIQHEFRNQLETAILNDFVIEINQPNQSQMNNQYIWDYRYRYFLNAISNNEILPASVELKDIVDYILENESESLFDYLRDLPGMEWPLEKNKELNPMALQNHGWLIMMFYHSDENYKRNITPKSYCKFVFKEDNCFTFSINDNYIHIQSNTSNILNYDWTIISVESENELSIKNMNLKNKQEIVYYIKNYKDLCLLDGRDTKQMMDILLF